MHINHNPYPQYPYPHPLTTAVPWQGPAPSWDEGQHGGDVAEASFDDLLAEYAWLRPLRDRLRKQREDLDAQLARHDARLGAIAAELPERLEIAGDAAVHPELATLIAGDLAEAVRNRQDEAVSNSEVVLVTDPEHQVDAGVLLVTAEGKEWRITVRPA